MKKFMMLAAVVALVAALVAVPALAQQHRFDDRDGFFVFFDDREDFFDFFDDEAEVEQSFEQEAESGDIDMSFSTSNTGDNSNVCAPALQFGNTGNLQNQQGVVQYGSVADDVGLEGSQFVFAPELATSCEQAVQQSAAASSW